MVVLLLLLGFIAVAAGMFGLGIGVPVRDTAFGTAMLVSASVTITGGFILVGLALAVAELRRVLQAGMRQMRPPERFEAERGNGVRRMEPRLGGVPGAPGGTLGGASGADAADVIPTRFDAPEATERPRKPVRDERPPSDGMAWGPAIPPPPAFQPASGAPRRTPAAAAPEGFDTIRPSQHRRSDKPDAEGVSEPPGKALPTGGMGAREVKSPPLSPAEAAGSAAIRPVRILKSGVISDVAYTLFSDGSIETQTPAGAQRFSSIDEFRRHLEKTD